RVALQLLEARTVLVPAVRVAPGKGEVADVPGRFERGAQRRNAVQRLVRRPVLAAHDGRIRLQREIHGRGPADADFRAAQLRFADVDVAFHVRFEFDFLDQVVDVGAPDVDLRAPVAGPPRIAEIDAERLFGGEVRIADDFAAPGDAGVEAFLEGGEAIAGGDVQCPARMVGRRPHRTGGECTVGVIGTEIGRAHV